MVDLTKSISSAQGAIQKTIAQASAPKMTQTAESVLSESASKVVEDIKKIDAISECAKAQVLANIPDYVYDILKKLNR